MKKKILSLFLAFAIMMTFMPSMAFAENVKAVNVNFILQESEDGLICDLVADNSLKTTFQCMFFDRDDNLICYFDADDSDKEGTWLIDSEDGHQLLSMEKALELFDIMDHVVLSGTVEPPAEGSYEVVTVVDAYLNGNFCYSEGTNTEYPYEKPDSDCPLIAKLNGQEGSLTVDIYYDIPHGNSLLEKILKGAAIAAGAAAVVGVVGTVVKNVQKAVVANQMAFQAKMQQQMVQKQVASIKTVLKGAGVVLSLASFGSSLGKFFQLNQFGFNTFGFNQFGFR